MFPDGKPINAMTFDFDMLGSRIRARQSGDGRILVAIAGAPASGKSTLAEKLCDHLGGDAGGAAVVPMDGFHFDNAILEERGRLARKGAPDTFDVGGLRRILLALRADDGEDVYVPVFDRGLEISRGAARCIAPHHRMVLVEGNYLLLDQPPWNRIAPLFDLSIYLDVAGDVLRTRLIDRWRGFGFAPEEALQKALGNDLPNTQTVTSLSRKADITLGAG